jgi:DNA repair exonuclease SbcCD ATPase subunit
VEEHIRLFGEGTCPTCGQEVKHLDVASLATKREALVAQRLTTEKAAREAWQQRRTSADQLVDILTKKVAALTEKVIADFGQRLAAATQAVASTRADHATWKAALERHRQGIERKKHLEQVVQGYGDLTLPSETEEQSFTRAIAQVQALQTSVTGLEAGLSVKQAALQGATTRRVKAEEARSRITAATDLPTPEEEEALRQATEKVFARTQFQRTLLDRQATLEVKLAEHEASYNRLSEQLAKEAKLATWLDICTRARAAVHPNGLPALMLREYTAVLNRRIQKYLSLWDAPFKLYLDNSMSFIAQYHDGCTHNAACLSGGQKIVASASFRLAMADTFASKAGMLVLDEPSVYLDKDSIIYLQKLLLKLKEYSGAAGKQIFLVTHEQALSGFFDHLIRVHRTQG